MGWFQRRREKREAQRKKAAARGEGSTNASAANTSRAKRERKEQSRRKKYNFLKKLGEGAFGNAYLAENTNGEKFVVKEIKDCTSEQAKQMYVSEAEILQRISSRGCEDLLVCTRETFEEKGKCYIVMDYKEDTVELSPEIFGKLSKENRRKVVTQLKEGLDKLHRKAIVHRDIKPANILINTKTHKITYIDFGLACWFFGDGACWKSIQGTPHYMSPELLLGKVFNWEDAKRVDQWALGMTIFGLEFDGIMDGEKDFGHFSDSRMAESFWYSKSIEDTFSTLMEYYESDDDIIDYFGLENSPFEAIYKKLLPKSQSGGRRRRTGSKKNLSRTKRTIKGVTKKRPAHKKRSTRPKKKTKRVTKKHPASGKKPLRPKKRCNSKTKDGLRCRNYVAKGKRTKCHLHAK
jgi:serine/threonine protein kinase